MNRVMGTKRSQYGVGVFPEASIEACEFDAGRNQQGVGQVEVLPASVRGEGRA